MRIGITGGGNVASALTLQLAAHNIDTHFKVTIAARSLVQAEAAILDAASAYPHQTSLFVATDQLKGDFDIVIATAAAPAHGDLSLGDLLKVNLAITLETLVHATMQQLIVVGTPVDRLTELITQQPQFKEVEVIGFGGQLDVERVKYALIKNGIDPKEQPVYVVGEHGPRCIPVYNGEMEYEGVREAAATTLKRIGVAGKPRNLASGVQLARLITALQSTNPEVLCISKPDPDFSNLSLTWPYEIDQNGLTKSSSLSLGPESHHLLKELIALRIREAKAG